MFYEFEENLRRLGGKFSATVAATVVAIVAATVAADWLLSWLACLLLVSNYRRIDSVRGPAGPRVIFERLTSTPKLI